MIAALLLILGFALLIKGADVFVGASVDIARMLKIPPVIIGLTVVAMGTSAPEIVISVTASLRGANALAISNVVGSNAFNLMFIIGLCALIRPMPVKLGEISKDFWISIFAAVLLLGLKLLSGEHIPRLGGGILLSVFAVYMFSLVRQALRARGEPENIGKNLGKPENKRKPLALVIFLALLGLAMILVGGQLTVDNATSIAVSLGVTERVIGLTIVAMGTSLPELIICLLACKRGENEFAIGNIVGSNIFNILFILGVAGLISPLEIDRALVLDTAFLIVGSLVALKFVYSGKTLGSREGLVMLLLYAGYMVFVLI